MGSVSEKSTKREEELKKAQRKGQAVGAVAGAGAIAAGMYALGEKNPENSSENTSSGTVINTIMKSTGITSICTGARYTINSIIGGFATGGITGSWVSLLAPTMYGALGAGLIYGAGKVGGFAYKKYKEHQYKKQQKKQIAMGNEIANARSQEKSNPVVVNNATAMENVAMASQLTH